jgi:four helix bundle protein
MTPQELRAQTQEFAVRVKRFCRPLLHDTDTVDPARQLARASASMAANYRATGISRSHKEFVARLGVVLEEADETVFWSQYLKDTGPASSELEAILDEAHQLTRIFNASRRTAMQHRHDRPDGPTQR